MILLSVNRCGTIAQSSIRLLLIKNRIVVGGQKQSIVRPRVRNANGEVELHTLSQLQDQDIFDDTIKEKMILGVSTRKYEPVMESWSEKLSISKSNVSRAFVRASKKDLELITRGDLSAHRFVAILLDGLIVSGRAVIAAIGITDQCQKIPIGLCEGMSENAEVVKDLLVNIRERGFTFHCEKILAVTDGSKALQKALVEVFGSRVIVQRCYLHKLRNLKQYVPDRLHGQLAWKMKRLMSLKTHVEAKKELITFVDWLSEISMEAERSMQEVGEELITVHLLGLTGDLRKSLSSTNIIESLIGAVREKTNRVKNWKKSKNKDQAQRWIASAMLAHQKKMRRLRGYKAINTLVESLNKKVIAKIEIPA